MSSVESEAQNSDESEGVQHLWLSAQGGEELRERALSGLEVESGLGFALGHVEGPLTGERAGSRFSRENA